jgi:hypothetical protein
MFDKQISMTEIFQHPDCCIGIAVLQDDGKVCEPDVDPAVLMHQYDTFSCLLSPIVFSSSCRTQGPLHSSPAHSEKAFFCINTITKNSVCN